MAMEMRFSSLEQQNKLRIMDDVSYDDEDDDSISSSDVSSLGSSDDESEGNSPRTAEGALGDMSDLLQQLPFKRGLSKHYQGKSQSFTSLANVMGIEDLPKPVNPYNKKLKSCKSYMALSKILSPPPPTRSASSSKLFSKKPPRSSCSSLNVNTNATNGNTTSVSSF